MDPKLEFVMPLLCASTWPRPSSADLPSMSSHLWSMRLMLATDSGSYAAILAASSRVAFSVAAPGEIWLTRLRRKASSHLITLELSSRYLAAESPQRLTNLAGPTGTPRAAPGKRIWRLEPPIRMSLQIAISAPPPTVYPWQAVSVGLGSWTFSTAAGPGSGRSGAGTSAWAGARIACSS